MATARRRALDWLAAMLVLCPSVALGQQTIFFHGSGTMDAVNPLGLGSTSALTTVGQGPQWAMPVPSGWTIPKGSYTLQYFTAAAGGSSPVDCWMWLSTISDCSVPTCRNAYGSGTMSASLVPGLINWTFNNTCSLGGGAGYFCFQIQVSGTPTGGGATLRFDSSTAPSFLSMPDDGGATGGGPTDGGTALLDGGTPTGPYEVGCDCGTGPGAAWACLSLVAIGLMRRAWLRPGT